MGQGSDLGGLSRKVFLRQASGYSLRDDQGLAEETGEAVDAQTCVKIPR